MPSREYYFQVINEIPHDFDTPVDPPYSMFYVERSDVGNIPIFNFFPGGGMWWFLDEDNIVKNPSRTEEPTPEFQEVAKEIASFDPVTQYIHGEAITASGEFTVDALDLPHLPEYEIDVLRETAAQLADGENLPDEMKEYLRSTLRE